MISHNAEARFSVRSGLRLAAAIIVFLATMSACAAAGQPERDTSATGLLDLETGQIVTPLSEYDLTDSEFDIAILNHAVGIFVGKCMAEDGFSYSATMAETSFPDDRDYGIWFEPNVKLYGWSFTPSPVKAAWEADAVAGGQEWRDAELACGELLREDADFQEILPSQEEETDSLVPNLRTEAYRLAAVDPEWQAARESWWECLHEAGLEPLTGANDWFSVQSKESLETSGPNPSDALIEEQILLASSEARCNNETRLTQRLSDLVASYQAPLIDRNQAALNELKQLKRERLDKAREYIAQHG